MGYEGGSRENLMRNNFASNQKHVTFSQEISIVYGEHRSDCITDPKTKLKGTAHSSAESLDFSDMVSSSSGRSSFDDFIPVSPQIFSNSRGENNIPQPNGGTNLLPVLSPSVQVMERNDVSIHNVIPASSFCSHSTPTDCSGSPSDSVFSFGNGNRSFSKDDASKKGVDLSKPGQLANPKEVKSRDTRGELQKSTEVTEPYQSTSTMHTEAVDLKRKTKCLCPLCCCPFCGSFECFLLPSCSRKCLSWPCCCFRNCSSCPGCCSSKCLSCPGCCSKNCLSWSDDCYKNCLNLLDCCATNCSSWLGCCTKNCLSCPGCCPTNCCSCSGRCSKNCLKWPGCYSKCQCTNITLVCCWCWKHEPK